VEKDKTLELIASMAESLAKMQQVSTERLGIANNMTPEEMESISETSKLFIQDYKALSHLFRELIKKREHPH